MSGSSRSLLGHGLIPLALLTLLVGACARWDLDFQLSDRFYDPVTHAWPLRGTFLLDSVLYRGTTRVLVAAGIVALGALALPVRRPHPWWRREVAFVLASVLAGSAAVTLAKRLVNRACPWSYRRYGGTVPDVPTGPLFSLEGHAPCAPAGHASGSYALMSLYFVFRRRSMRLAVLALAFGLTAGSVVGLAQVARGAHFLSHNLWTAAICWFASLALRTIGWRDLPEGPE